VRERIFEPFFTTKPRGTGLGLAIVQKRLDEIGGRIECESPWKEGRGTKFTVSLSRTAPGV
jgi:signal transduction histidine kinase